MNNKNNKNNKKKSIIIIILILCIIVGFLIFKFTKNSSNNSQKILLSCDHAEYATEYFSLYRIVKVYEKNNDKIFFDRLELVQLTDDEKINKALENYFSLRSNENLTKGYVQLKKEKNKLILELELNFSEHSEEDIKKYINMSDISIEGIEKTLLEGGWTCEKE